MSERSARRMNGKAFASFTVCPVERCPNYIRRASLVVCSSCWGRAPHHLRARLALAHEQWRTAGFSDYEARLEDLDEAKELIIAAAEGHQLRDEERERIRANARAKAARRLGLAA